MIWTPHSHGLFDFLKACRTQFIWPLTGLSAENLTVRSIICSCSTLNHCWNIYAINSLGYYGAKTHARLTQRRVKILNHHKIGKS